MKRCSWLSTFQGENKSTVSIPIWFWMNILYFKHLPLTFPEIPKRSALFNQMVNSDTEKMSVVYTPDQPTPRTHCLQPFPSTSSSLSFNSEVSMVTQDLNPQNSQVNNPLQGNVWSFVSKLLSSAWVLPLKALLFSVLMKRTEDGMCPEIIFLTYSCFFVNWEKNK